jgi:hypothetical protein
MDSSAVFGKRLPEREVRDTKVADWPKFKPDRRI